MWQLYAGVILFAGTHLWSMLARNSRDSAKSIMGEKRYKGLYALVSSLGLVLLSWAYWSDRFSPATMGSFYEPWLAARHITMLLVFIGFVLIFSNQSKGYIRKYLQHPFSIGVALLSLGHLLANGEKTVVTIFAMLLLVSLIDIVKSLSRGKIALFVPLWKQDLRGIIVGLVLFAVFLFGFHPYVLKVPVL